MSIRQTDDVWRKSKHKGGALLLLLAISDYADDNGRAYPSIRMLAQKTRLTPRQVANLLRLLLKSGELVVESAGGGRGKANTYRVCVNPEVENTEKISLKSISLKSSVENPEISGTKTLKFPVLNRPASIDPSYDPSDPSYISPKVDSYTHKFEKAWEVSPKRKTETGDSKKAAWNAWKARMRAGVAEDELLAGMERYAAYVSGTGADRVKQASTFFGPNEFWKQPWGFKTLNPSSAQPEIRTADEYLRSRA